MAEGSQAIVDIGKDSLGLEHFCCRHASFRLISFEQHHAQRTYPMKLGWKTRVGLMLSAAWLCLVFLVTDDYHRIGQVIGLGFLPLVVLWGSVWAVAGWRAQHPTKSESPERTLLEERQKRYHRIRTLITVLVVLASGWFAAIGQFHAKDSQADGNSVAYWFGEWMVYGLLAYVVFRLFPRMPPRAPAILAALLVVCAVNYKTHAAISENHQALASIAKAVPLINKIQSGVQVSEQEVKDAKVGMMEPLMLARVAYSNETIGISATYTEALSNLQAEVMLTPTSLASSSIRTQTRAKLEVWQQVTADYKSQLDAASARGKLGIQAAKSRMPASMAESASKGFDKALIQLDAYLFTHASSEKEAIKSITELLDLMDANPGSYAVDKGPPVKLLFRDEVTLARYRELMNAVVAASRREAEAQARLIKTESDQMIKLTDLLKH
jgi:hypothetical protein